MNTYVIIIYAFFSISTIVGALNNSFDANLTQRVALSIFGIWAIWRINLVIENGWAYPHEPVIATALGLYALGTILKTIKYCKR